jgi:hypothetical protein
MSIEIGGCSFSFGPKPLEEALHMLKDLGFDIVDVGVCPGNTQIDPVQAAKSPEDAALKLNTALGKLGMRPEECFVLDFGNPVNHPDETVRRNIRALFSQDW